MRQPETPSLPPGTDGIRIQFAPAPALAAGRLVIFGACALAADSAVQLNDTLLDNGWSFTTQNIIVIASRGWYDTAYPEAKKKAIVIHEAGHKIGLVPNGDGSLVEQSTLDKVHDPAATKFHCNDRECTMWWTTEFQKSA